jgi:hypothetical protein
MTVTEETPARRPGRLAAAWRSGPLGVSAFRLLAFGQFTSTIGDYCYAVAPFLGGLPGVAAGMAVFGIATGFDNVVSITLIQRWAPPTMLGRVWGLLTLASVGSFPVATFVAGLLVRHLGPTPVFPISGALLALSMLYGLTQREFRDFGTPEDFGTPAEERSPTPA